MCLAISPIDINWIILAFLLLQAQNITQNIQQNSYDNTRNKKHTESKHPVPLLFYLLQHLPDSSNFPTSYPLRAWPPQASSPATFSSNFSFFNDQTSSCKSTSRSRVNTSTGPSYQPWKSQPPFCKTNPSIHYQGPIQSTPKVQIDIGLIEHWSISSTSGRDCHCSTRSTMQPSCDSDKGLPAHSLGGLSGAG